MKTLKKIPVTLMALMVVFSLFSCQNDDSNALGWDDVYTVTVVPDTNGSFHLVSDKGKTLEPAQKINFNPKEEKQRAIAILTFSEKQSDVYDHVVNIHSLDTFLTKPIAADLGDENIKVYGNDPVTIDSYWIGDGYLNIWFGTYWGGKTHFINLVQTDEENNPYELDFRHNANDDVPVQFEYSIVAFDLSSLPDTNGKEVDLKINVRLYNNGQTTLKLKYNSNKKLSGTPPDNVQSMLSQNYSIILE
ncbi:MAG: NigD-like protein [Tannerellaceae bacterium]|nr:NigD-like protein [Tannerellaceae bacterium]